MYLRCSQASPLRQGLLSELEMRSEGLRKSIRYQENDSGKKLLQLLCLALLTSYTQTSHFTSCDFHMFNLLAVHILLGCLPFGRLFGN